MSKTVKTVSDPEHVEQKNDSVYDFLYHDVRRVGSFLSQFDDAGLLTQITQSEGAERGARRGWKASAGGSVAGMGSANVAMERTPEKGGYQAADRVYDPLWTNALTFLDFLTERDLLSRDITTARIGQFVLASGSLSIQDLKLLRGLWDLPALRSGILRGMGINVAAPINMESRSDRKKVNQGRDRGYVEAKSEAEETLDAGLSLIGMLPHVIQARMTCTSGETIWASLTEDELVVSAADVLLKHGTSMAGEWFALGVLDALPEATDLTSPAVQDAGILGSLMAGLMPMMRPLLGRPYDAFGLTPLLIFRAIAS